MALKLIIEQEYKEVLDIHDSLSDIKRLIACGFREGEYPKWRIEVTNEEE